MDIRTHNGFITIKSLKTGEHRTFRIHTQPDDAKFAPGKRVVSLLVGPDNTNDYLPFAFLIDDPDRGATRQLFSRVVCWKRYRGTKYEQFASLLSDLRHPYIQRQVEVHWDARCRKCNRVLTTPESVRLGIGPVCRGAEDGVDAGEPLVIETVGV